jgi:hypothetical protein
MEMVSDPFISSNKRIQNKVYLIWTEKINVNLNKETEVLNGWRTLGE